METRTALQKKILAERLGKFGKDGTQIQAVWV